MQAIPAIDGHGKEGDRSTMAALCPRLAAAVKSIHEARANAEAWQQAAAGSVPELPPDLQQNTKTHQWVFVVPRVLVCGADPLPRPLDGLQPASW